LIDPSFESVSESENRRFFFSRFGVGGIRINQLAVLIISKTSFRTSEEPAVIKI
jgi:hypothetical protein